MPPPPRTTLFPYTTLFRSPPFEHAVSRRSNRRRDRARPAPDGGPRRGTVADRKSTRLNSSHANISYAAPTENYTLSLHDALPISTIRACGFPAVEPAPRPCASCARRRAAARDGSRSEEHTSELQSRQYLVCRPHRELHSFPTRRSSDLHHSSMRFPGGRTGAATVRVLRPTAGRGEGR